MRRFRSLRIGFSSYPTDVSSNRKIGGDNSSGVGKSKAATEFSTPAAIGSIFSSILIRDCACFAFEAFALNLSTKLCKCSLVASCLRAIDSCSASLALLTLSNVS